MGVFNIISADRPWTIYKFPRELIEWRDAVIGFGGAKPSMAEMVRRNKVIHAHVIARSWRLVDDILMSGEDEVQSLVSLKKRKLCIRWNTPFFSQTTGFVFDGYAMHVEWPFYAASQAVAMTATNKRLAMWNLKLFRQSNNAFGTFMTNTNKMILRPFTTTDSIVVGINTQPSPEFALPEPLTSKGFTVGSTSSATIMRCYKDGVRLADQTATIAPGLSIEPFYLGGAPNATTMVLMPCAIPYAEIGAQLSDVQELIIYRAVRDAVAGMFVADDDEDEDD